MIGKIETTLIAWCERCLRSHDTGKRSLKQAMKALIAAGWIRGKDDDDLTCPDCAKRQRRSS